MDYEKKLRGALRDNNTPYIIQAWLEEHFPELRKSEDEEIIEWLINDIKNALDDCIYRGESVEDAEKALAWFEKQKKPDWSEEDDRTLGYLLAVLEDGIPTDSGKMEKIVDWLKSLKQRYIWKPSEEQIKAIRLARSFVTDDFGDNPTLSEILVELEKQLNKLK